MRNRRWVWVVLFIVAVVVVAGLATGWNIAIFQDYQRFMESLRGFGVSPKDAEKRVYGPWISLILGTLGFLVAIGTVVLFFTRLLKEMKLNQLQSEFLASVSHTLKTPIATIELSASMLREGGLAPDEAARLWESHEAELKRLKEQVDTLLEAARMEAEPLRPRRALVGMETWISGSMGRWRQILGPRGELVREGEPLRCEAWVDTRMLNLIVENLLDNSRKFARTNAPRVVLESHLLPARWQLRVRDEGWGFPPEDAERIFNRFFRAKTEAPYAIPGTGLGLYLVATAARALGITIRGESDGLGRGASFVLEGPRVSS